VILNFCILGLFAYYYNETSQKVETTARSSNGGDAAMDEIRRVPAKIKLRAEELGERLLAELQAYHRIYSPLFKRSEQREQSLKYLQGLLSDSPNKSVECMMLHMAGDQPNAIRAAQQFIGQGGGTMKRSWVSTGEK
jgi:hypothetical protein